jgi:predicted dinucleotide-utilizing enzyme
MPELPVKEVRLPELQLPELDRAGIVRTLSEIRRPTIDLPDMERPTAQLREGLAKIDWTRIDPTAIDIGRAAASVAAIARMGRPILRSRWTLVAGTLVVIGLAGAALLSNPKVRERAGRTVDGVRARIDARSGAAPSLDVEADPELEPVAEAEASIVEPAEVVTAAEAVNPA